MLRYIHIDGHIVVYMLLPPIGLRIQLRQQGEAYSCQDTGNASSDQFFHLLLK